MKKSEREGMSEDRGRKMVEGAREKNQGRKRKMVRYLTILVFHIM